MLVMSCVLCRLPTTADDAVLIAERGAVCPGVPANSKLQWH